MEENYCLLGISTDEPDYKLCWLINDQLRMSFLKTENLQVFHKKLNEEQEFSLFQFDDENAMLVYRIIGNRTDTGNFLSELKNIDFLLHIQGDIIQDDISRLVQKLNSLEAVRMCVSVDLGKLKEKDRLLLW
jgi:hypothetical protein